MHSLQVWDDLEDDLEDGVESFARREQENPVSLADEKFRACGHLSLRGVSCEYRQGILFLRGTLPSYYLKQLAQSIVRDIDAIEQIENQIKVIKRT